MAKKIFTNKRGFTLMELMVAIAVIAVISAVSVLYVRGNINDEVEMYAQELSSDLKLARNMAVSRTVYDFGGTVGAIYPPGGYGVYINNPADGSANYYIIYADSGTADGYNSTEDPTIKRVNIDNTDIGLDDFNNSDTSHYFAFKSENEASTDFVADDYGNYELLVRYPGPGYPEKGYQAVLHLGEISDDAYIWSNIGIQYSIYTPSAPKPPQKDPIDRLQVSLGRY